MHNLSRKWRPASFNDVVGQEMIVRLLKNTLYRDVCAPAYLFMGQRGCGKTTLARIFAAAVNCHQLDVFRTTPKETQVPCGLCGSCVAMKAGSHPDFMEIDAASHTGVDDMRAMLETTMQLPQMGRKKIYLIDESHMLSKAACNALLKTLEEPPATVLFLMATTDAHKMLDTIRSRCFPLHISMHTRSAVVERLKYICDHEVIPYKEEALSMIAYASEGSLREAINALEQVYISVESVTALHVMQVLGVAPLAQAYAILSALCVKDGAQLRVALQEIAAGCRIRLLWAQVVELLQALISAHHGVIPACWSFYDVELKKLVGMSTIADSMAIARIFFESEELLLRTTSEQSVFEYIAMRACMNVATFTQKSLPEKVVQLQKEPVAAIRVEAPVQKKMLSSEEVNPAAESPKKVPVWWNAVLDAVRQTDNPLRLSLVQQMTFILIDEKNNRFHISLPHSLSMWSELLAEVKTLIEHVARSQGKPLVELEFKFDRTDAARAQVKTAAQVGVAQPSVRKREQSIDVVADQDKELMKKVLEIFPGTITHIKEIKE